MNRFEHLMTVCAVFATALVTAPLAAATLDIDTTATTVDGIDWYHGVFDTSTGLNGTDEDDEARDFFLYKPNGYDAANPDPDAKHPLIIFLHDAGQRDADLTDHLDSAGLTYWTQSNVQAQAPGGGAFVLAPKIRGTDSHDRWAEVNWKSWNGDGYDYSTEYSADSTTALDSMRRALTTSAGLIAGGDNTDNDFYTQIDPSRVYVVGQSMGGIGAWDAVARTNRVGDSLSELETWLIEEGDGWSAFDFAAAIPIAGIAPNDRAGQLASLAIWAMHHPDDDEVLYDGTITGIDQIEQYLADTSAFYETSHVTASGDQTNPISEDLETLLAYQRLMTIFSGDPDSDFSGEHSWVVNTWPFVADSPQVAQWLFSQQMPVPEPTSGLLVLGGGALLLGRSHRQAKS